MPAGRAGCSIATSWPYRVVKFGSSDATGVITNVDSPYSRLPVESGEVRLLLGAKDDPAMVDNCDRPIEGSTKGLRL